MRALESLGMYTGISEPVDFEVTDGAERAASAGKAKTRKPRS